MGFEGVSWCLWDESLELDITRLRGVRTGLDSTVWVGGPDPYLS